MNITQLRDAFEEIQLNFKDLFQRVSQLEAAPLVIGGGGGGAPVDAEYLVNSANVTLTNEIVVTAAQGRIIYGDGTPTWTTLNIGTQYKLLQTNNAGTLPEWATFDWDNHIITAGGDGIHDHSSNAEGGEIPLASLDGYTQGDLIYGGAADWQDLAIGANGTILYSNGTIPGWQTLSSAGVAPNDATYIVVSLTGDLTQERNLDINNGLVFVDNGADNSYQVDLGTPSTLSTASINSVTANSHTHEITTTSDGSSNHNTILQSNASGQVTMDDYYTIDGGQVGISGNELLTFNAVGNIAISGADLNLPTGLGITHTDGVTAGEFLRANGTRYMPSGFYLSGTAGQTYTFPSTSATLLSGSGAANRVTYWSDANTLASDAGLTYNAATDSLTAGDYFTGDGGQFGISGNELFTVNAAGTFAFSGISGITLEDADWIGNGAATARLGFDSSGATDKAYFEDCNVGIGESAPSDKLEINGGNVTVYNSGNAPRLRIGDDTNNYTNAQWSTTYFKIVTREAGTLYDDTLVAKSGRVGVGTTTLGGKTTIDQSSTTAAIPVLELDQADVSEEMINFIVAATGAGNPVDTGTAVGSTYARLRVAVNGTFKYIQLYNA